MLCHILAVFLMAWERPSPTLRTRNRNMLFPGRVAQLDFSVDAQPVTWWHGVSGKGSVVSFKVPFPHGNSRIPPPTPPFQEIWPYQVVTNHRCPLLSAWWWQVVRSNYPCVLDSTLVGLKICLYHIWISYVHIPKYTQLTVCMRTYVNIEVTA